MGDLGKQGGRVDQVDDDSNTSRIGGDRESIRNQRRVDCDRRAHAVGGVAVRILAHETASGA